MSDDDFLIDEDLAEASAASGGSGASDDDEELTLLTREGLKKLKEELDELKNVRRKEVAQRLKEAISYGDLSENSEYEEAKNEQAFLEGRVLELERKIKNAKIITERRSEKRGKEITVGSTVTFRNRTKQSDEESFTIVGATEADPFDAKISNESPIGKALLSHCSGETINIDTPAGLMRYEILKVQ
ncbi:transcription elongation factor GreA [Candidatus Peregrinibacteria bacterium]|nr:transcription elongation factor GreA [Candidatus Peregrinibacteria bacterium]